MNKPTQQDYAAAHAYAQAFAKACGDHPHPMDCLGIIRPHGGIGSALVTNVDDPEELSEWVSDMVTPETIASIEAAADHDAKEAINRLAAIHQREAGEPLFDTDAPEPEADDCGVDPLLKGVVNQLEYRFGADTPILVYVEADEPEAIYNQNERKATLNAFSLALQLLDTDEVKPHAGSIMAAAVAKYHGTKNVVTLVDRFDSPEQSEIHTSIPDPRLVCVMLAEALAQLLPEPGDKDLPDDPTNELRAVAGKWAGVARKALEVLT